MKIISEVFASMIGQGTLGFVIIFIILALGIYGIVSSIKLKKCYEDLRSEFKKSEIINEDTGEKNLKGTALYEISEEFKKSASKGTENINTEVLMEKYLRKYITINEKFVNLLPSTSIALGLIGTFLGLTVAIHSTNGVLESGIKTMDIFLNKMGIPLQGMASAFWTSIFGVIMSLVLNYTIQITKREKEEFYDDFEDYLDNILYSEYAFSFVTQFERFNDVISASMIDLSREMRDLFKEGVDQLVSNINKNTIDMTESAKVLSNYTKDLELVISSLNKSVDNFKKPIDMFKSSIDDFDITTEKLEFIMNTSITRLSEKIDVLSDVLNKLDINIEEEKESIKLINEELRSYKVGLDKSYRELLKGTENISKAIEKNNDITNEQIKNLNKGYEGFENGINNFIANVERLRYGVGEVISKVLKEELLGISEEIAEKLQKSIKGIEEATESLSYNTRTVGELVHATNEWVAATSDE